MANNLGQKSAQSINAIDRLCFDALTAIVSQAKQGLTDLSSDVFSSMSKTLDDDSSKDAMAHLMALYDGATNKQGLDHNEAVGDMVELLQEKMDSGEDVSIEQVEGISYDGAVSLAEHQKKLESLVLADERLRQSIVPAMASMQIEDSINQRLSHLLEVWQSLTELLERSDGDASQVAEDQGKRCHSAEQASDYYGLVLEQKAPEAIEKRSVFIEF